MSSPTNHLSYSILPGESDLPRVILTAPDGARAEIYLHGAQLTSWIPAGGEEQIYLSPKAEYGPGTAIRGGIPIIFPQFGNMGNILKHGFARRAEWAFLRVESDASRATAFFQLADHEATRRIWPFAFRADVAVSIGGNRLNMDLAITNPGDQAFSFTCALHTYFRIRDIGDAGVSDLAAVHYIDAAGGGVDKIQPEGELTFHGEVDRIYTDAPTVLTLRDADRRLEIRHQGFPDVVIWNPGQALGTTLPDLEPDGYRHTVCIEPAVARQKVVLSPTERWLGSQSLEAQ